MTETTRHALELLGRDRLLSFTRSVSEGNCTAPKVLQDHLEEGEALESIFELKPFLEGQDALYGFQLSAVEIGDGHFAINLGCQAGPLAGDGGSWEVTFDDEGNVVDVTGGQTWIS